MRAAARRPLAERLGVCSWSLRARTPTELARRVRATGLERLQLGLDPLRRGAWRVTEVERALAAAKLQLCSAMLGFAGEDYSTPASIAATGGLRPTAHWAENLARVRAVAALAWRLRLPLVSFHAGFLPRDRRDPERALMVGRLAQVTEIFAAHGVGVALETGQEDTETLLAVLAETGHPGLGVNFDPANLLLYGTGEPLEALAALLPVLRQVHVKDARRSSAPGEWGQEVAVGDGEVDWPGCLALLERAGFDGELMIEREAGSDRVADVQTARVRLLQWAATVPA